MAIDESPLRRGAAAAAVEETFELLPQAVCVLEGPRHRIVASNAAHRRMVGRSEVVGELAAEVFSAAIGQRLFEMLDQVYRSGEPYAFREWRVGLVDDAGRPFEVFMDCDVLPRLNPDGSVLGLVLLAEDATRRVMDQRAARAAADRAEQRYEQARDVLAALQRELLPAGLPVLPGVRVAGSYLLADADTAAGGDWFDAVALPDGRVALTVGDVVGHGVAASATMGQLRAVLGHALATGTDVTAAIAAADRMASRTRGARAATVCVAVLDPADGTLVYATAGHPPPLLLPARGEPRFLPTTGGGPLGTGSTFPLRTERLDEHDIVLLCTDGILERPGLDPSAATIDLARTAADVAAGRGLRDDGPAVERICTQTLELLVRETGPRDDITLLAAQRVPPVPVLRVEHPAEIAAVPVLRAALHEWLDDLGASDADGFGILHGIGELVANAVQHARPATAAAGTVTLHARLAADGVVHLEVRDQGRWHRRRGGTALGEPPRASGRGRGLEMVRGLLDTMQVEPGPEGTTVRVTHRLAWPARLLTAEEVHSGAATAPTLRPEVARLHVADQPATTGARLRVDGPIDADTAEQLELELRRHTRGGTRPLTLDLTSATHLASAGVAVLHALDGLRLYAPSGSVAQQVLALVALPHLTQDPDPAAATATGPLDRAFIDDDDIDDDEVHQATGIVMVQLAVSGPDALARLRAHAFAHERPLIDVASDVVEGRLRFTEEMT